MSEKEVNPQVSQRAVMELSNELNGLFNTERARLLTMREELGSEEADDNLDYTYLKGKVVGIELCASALEAFIVARNAEAMGTFTPEGFNQQD